MKKYLNKLENMDVIDLQWICKYLKINCENNNKKEIIKKLLEPIKKYNMNKGIEIVSSCIIPSYEKDTRVEAIYKKGPATVNLDGKIIKVHENYENEYNEYDVIFFNDQIKSSVILKRVPSDALSNCNLEKTDEMLKKLDKKMDNEKKRMEIKNENKEFEKKFEYDIRKGLEKTFIKHKYTMNNIPIYIKQFNFIKNYLTFNDAKYLEIFSLEIGKSLNLNTKQIYSLMFYVNTPGYIRRDSNPAKYKNYIEFFFKMINPIMKINLPDPVKMLCIKLIQEYVYLLFHKNIDETKEYNEVNQVVNWISGILFEVLSSYSTGYKLLHITNLGDLLDSDGNLYEIKMSKKEAMKQLNNFEYIIYLGFNRKQQQYFPYIKNKRKNNKKIQLKYYNDNDIINIIKMSYEILHKLYPSNILFQKMNKQVIEKIIQKFKKTSNKNLKKN